MRRRVRLLPTLLLTATGLVIGATIGAACGGNPYGSCVTYYTDGDVYRYNTDKQYCEDTCAERIAESSVIASCYFEGAKAAPVEP